LTIFLKLIKFLPPELAHSLSLISLKILHKLLILKFFYNKPESSSFSFLNLTFKNKLGTAAGLDKNGDYIDCLGALGFGFLEIGTVTPLPQNGNTKPRIFRVFEENAVINRLGFNNKGIEHLLKNLKNRSYDGIVGVNIGANKDSKENQRIEDYLICINKIHQYADYITVNISSPNTPGLRELQSAKNISQLIERIDAKIKSLNYVKPIFLKISPDESQSTIHNIIEKIDSSSFSGLIATNTTIDKTSLKSAAYRHLEGGLSGEPLFKKSTSMISYIKKISPEIPIIGVGGVISNTDYQAKLDAGASLVQLYTGFIIKGPTIINDILGK
jgi:dihydroorotate dehydrogenase